MGHSEAELQGNRGKLVARCEGDRLDIGIENRVSSVMTRGLVCSMLTYAGQLCTRVDLLTEAGNISRRGGHFSQIKQARG